MQCTRLISMQDPPPGIWKVGLIARNPYCQATHTEQRAMHTELTSSVLTRAAALAYGCCVRRAASHEAKSFLAHPRAMVGAAHKPLGNKGSCRGRLLHSSVSGEITPHLIFTPGLFPNHPPPPTPCRTFSRLASFLYGYIPWTHASERRTRIMVRTSILGHLFQQWEVAPPQQHKFSSPHLSVKQQTT